MSILKKSLFVVLLAAVLCAFAVFASAEDGYPADCSGTIGGLTWTYNSGNLYIEGSGAIPDISGYSFWKYGDTYLKIERVVLSEGITSIGNNLFSYTALEMISIPNTVTSIGDYAFENTKLTGIDLPDNLTYLGEEAFAGCTSLKSIVVPDGVTEIKRRAFKGCTALESVTLPNSVTSIGVGAFIDTNISEIDLPDNLTELGESAFANCINLKNVIFSEGLTVIKETAFNGCTSLEYVDLPDSVTSIQGNAFSFSGLKEVDFPASLKTLYFAAFASTYIEEAILSEGLEYLDGAFCNCAELKEIYIPSTVTEIGDGLVEGCTSLTSVIIPDSVVSMGMFSFAGCTSLTEVKLSENVDVLPDRTFENCTSLVTVRIPKAVKEVQYGVFSGCVNLEYIYFNSLPEISGLEIDSYDKYFVFYNCNKMTIRAPYSWNYVRRDPIGYAKDNGVPYIIGADVTDTISYSYDENTDTITFSGTGTIPEEDFMSKYPWGEVQSNVKTVVFESGITEVPKSAFRECENLETIILSDTIEKINFLAFSQSTALKSVDLPESILEIGQSAFEYCGLTSVDIPDSVVSIGYQAFKGCEFLSDIRLNDNVYIGSYAFSECPAIEKIVIPKNVDVGPEAFTDSPNVVILCYENSEAHEYAVENNIPFEIIDGTTPTPDPKPDPEPDPEPTPNPDIPFEDIKPDKWYTEGVLWCFERGYMAGTSETVFGYKDVMDRQMFATILAKIDNADTSAYSEMSFNDVPADKWYSNSIEWAYQNGYASGIGEGVYGRKNPVTREQLAMFFFTYSEKKGYNVSGRSDISGFADYDRVHSWAQDALSWAVNEGLIAGTSDTTVSPRDSATRATVALIIKNYVENVIE